MNKLTVLECRQCHRRLAPPAYACSGCGSPDVAAIEISARGRLYTHTTIYVPPAGFEHLAPYTVAVVELDGLLLPGRMQLRDDPVPPIGATIEVVEAGEGFYVFAAAT